MFGPTTLKGAEALVVYEMSPSVWLVLSSFLHGNCAHLVGNFAILAPCLLLIERKLGCMHVILFWLILALVQGVLCLHFGQGGIGSSAVAFGTLALAVGLYTKGIYRLILVPGLVFFMSEIAVWWIPDGIGHLAHGLGYAVGLMWLLCLSPEIKDKVPCKKCCNH